MGERVKGAWLATLARGVVCPGKDEAGDEGEPGLGLSLRHREPTYTFKGSVVETSLGCLNSSQGWKRSCKK